MSDQNPQEPRPEEENDESREGWTWERPADGSPVYGADPDATAERALDQQPPSSSEPAPIVEQPNYSEAGQTPYDLPSPTGSPVFGPAQPPDEAAHDRQYQEQYSRHSEYDQQWQQQNYSQQQFYPVHQQEQVPYNSEQYYAPYQTAPVPYDSRAGVSSLVASFIGVALVPFCPFMGIVGGIIGLALAVRARNAARQAQAPTNYENVAVWLSVLAIIASIVVLAMNLIVFFLFQDVFDQMMI